MTEPIIGIDLGTTNSEVAAFTGDRISILGPSDARLLPSCVGLAPDGELLVGLSARNQLLLHPDRTVRSIKRRMGSTDTVRLGDQEFTPQQISAVILRELVQWATDEIGTKPTSAVITVPAYFSDAQRQATREAGQLAGLDVARILNEPTAASLAYGCGEERETVMVYDLGGGTFDVSVVRLEGGITEVLASHGDNQLGGDDFNDLLVDHLVAVFEREHGLDLRGRDHAAALSRVWWAAEVAKQTLSSAPHARVLEENLVVSSGRPRHLDVEIGREDYEAMIQPLVERTLESVTRALNDAGIRSRDLDRILLVGGSTRTPLIQRTLAERAGTSPQHEVHPDLCVALGAGVLASRLAGHEVQRVLVDITPYAFGISHIGERGGVPYPHCYRPIIEHNTALPVTRTERYFTSVPYQERAEINIYQGDDPDALRNVLVGRFITEDLSPSEDSAEILCRMRLDLDGILEVTATEKATGLAKRVTIDGAMTPPSDAEIEETRQHLERLHDSRVPRSDCGVPSPTVVGIEADSIPAATTQVVERDGREQRDAGISETGDAEWLDLASDGGALAARSRALLERMHPDDREDAVELAESIEGATQRKDREILTESCAELRELLYFVEGRGGGPA